MKTELREEVSGHTSVSDVDLDSDFPTEVNTEQSNGMKCLKTFDFYTEACVAQTY